MNFLALWAGIPEPVRKAIMWIGAILAVILLGRAYIEAKKDEARQKERAANAQRNAEEYARTVQTSSQVKEELHDKIDASRDAVAALPDVSSADELRNTRPDLAQIVFGDRPGNGG